MTLLDGPEIRSHSQKVENATAPDLPSLQNSCEKKRARPLPPLNQSEENGDEAEANEQTDDI